jgi:hypothetical protein
MHSHYTHLGPAAGIVMLAVTVGALGDTPKPWFEEAHFPETLPGLTRKDVNANQHWQMPRHAVLGEDVTWSLIRALYESEGRRPAGSLSIQLHYYPREGDALVIFDNLIDGHQLRRHVKNLSGRVNREVLSKVLKRKTVSSAVYDHNDGRYASRRVVCRGKYVLDIWAHGTRKAWSADKQFLSAVNAAEQAAYGAIRRAGGRLESREVSLDAQHVHPFQEPLAKDFAPGDIIVTVTDQAGEPLAGREVVFTIADYNPESPIVRMPFGAQGEEPAVTPYLPAAVDRRGWMSDFTDSQGRAVINYVHGGGFAPLLRYGPLAQRLVHEDKVRVVVVAVLLDRTLDEAFADKRAAVAEAMTTVELEFTHVAQVTGLGSKHMGQTPDPKVEVVGSPESGTPVRRVGVYITRADALGLNKGDVIRIHHNCIVHLEWLNGLKMVVIPKEGWLEGNKFSTLTICPTDAGAYQRYKALFKDKWTGLGVSGTGLTVGTVSAPAGALASVVTAVTNFLWSWYEETSDPFLVEMHSRVVLDPGAEIGIYTFEGSAGIHAPGAEAPVEVPAGMALTVSARQGLSEPVPFETDAVSRDIRLVADELETLAAESARPSGRSGRRGQDEGGMSIGAVVGISLGSIVAVAALLAVVLVMRRRTGRRPAQQR